MKQLSVIVLGFVVVFVIFFATYPGCYARARMLELMGVNEAAKTTYGKILDRAPETPWAERSEERLAFLEAVSLDGSVDDGDASPQQPEPTARPSLADQTLMPIQQAQQQEAPAASSQKSPTKQVAAPKPKQQPKEERRIEPSYGGPLGAYHHSKNKINDIQKKHNKDLMKQMQD